MPQGDNTPERSIILPDLTKMKKRKKRKKSFSQASQVSIPPTLHDIKAPQTPQEPPPQSSIEPEKDILSTEKADILSTEKADILSTEKADIPSAPSPPATTITELEKTEMIPVSVEPLPVLLGPKPIAHRETEDRTDKFDDKTEIITDPYPSLNEVTDKKSNEVTEKTDKMKLQPVVDTPIVMIEESTAEFEKTAVEIETKGAKN